jgi:hypothetical protein
MKEIANIFVLIDGLGWEWVKESSFLSELAPYRRRLKSVLGFSAGAIPSILTGRYPEEHGRMAMYRLAEEGRSAFKNVKWLCSLPPALTENRYVRHGLQAALKRFGGLRGYFNLYAVPLRYLPLLDVEEKRDLYRPGGISEATSIFDLLQHEGIPFRSYSYRLGSDERIIKLARADLNRAEASFFFLYLAEVDAFLHANADQAGRLAPILEKYDAWLRSLYAVAKERYEKVQIHVFSDHGMAPTREVVDMASILGPLRLGVPDDYLYLLDSTMARFWFRSEHARRLVVDTLSRQAPGHWITDDELSSLGAMFEDKRYGHAIFLLPESHVIAPSHMGREAPHGMHGFHPRDGHSYAAFLSSEDYQDAPNHITDVFRIMKTNAIRATHDIREIRENQ